MNVEAYMVVHYGVDYIPYAIASVYDEVKQIHVVYSPYPSHGHSTNVPPVETEDQVYLAVHEYDPDEKVIWHRVENIRDEGPLRDHALSLCDSDLALVVDCDEVWPRETLRRAIRLAHQGNTRDLLVNFTTPWRSFNYVVRDDMWPIRIIDKRRAPGDGVQYLDRQNGPVFHFGYAVADRIMRYKWLIHGHKGELRSDWWDKWDAWPPPKDVHPTCVGFWNPEPFDRKLLPMIMRGHPFWDMDRIE